MTPVAFQGSNIVFAKDQSPYKPLPAHRAPGTQGRVTSCWKLTWKEKAILLFTGRLWLAQLTFDKPLQPQLLTVLKPRLA